MEKQVHVTATSTGRLPASVPRPVALRNCQVAMTVTQISLSSSLCYPQIFSENVKRIFPLQGRDQTFMFGPQNHIDKVHATGCRIEYFQLKGTHNDHIVQLPTHLLAHSHLFT